jgi:hypothetical protein
MNDTPDFLRKQMQETKSQLSEKLESLEQQFSDAVQSTGTAVNSTVQAVEHATHFLSNALDVRRQINRHPWLVLGGAIVVGYVAVDLLKGPKNSNLQGADRSSSVPDPAASDASQKNATRTLKSTENATAFAATRHPSRKGSSWDQLRNIAMRSLMATVPIVVAQIVPRILNQVMDDWVGTPTNHAENLGEPQSSRTQKQSSEAAQRLRIAVTESVRSQKIF